MRINTPQGPYRFKPVFLYPGRKVVDREIAMENLRLLQKRMDEAGIPLLPVFGSLLGVVRDRAIIPWDEDIDLAVSYRDEQKLLSLLWTLREDGLELVRYDKRGLYSVMRKGEYIDFYIFQPVEGHPRVWYSIYNEFQLQRHLEQTKPYDFQGIPIRIPEDYDGCLTAYFGDWRTPVKYFDYAPSAWRKGVMRVKAWSKTLVPKAWYPALIRRMQRRPLEAFIGKCRERISEEGL